MPLKCKSVWGTFRPVSQTPSNTQAEDPPLAKATLIATLGGGDNQNDVGYFKVKHSTLLLPTVTNTKCMFTMFCWTFPALVQISWVCFKGCFRLNQTHSLQKPFWNHHLLCQNSSVAVVNLKYKFWDCKKLSYEKWFKRWVLNDIVNLLRLKWDH